MWTRELIKKKAKLVLKNNYWKAFLISLVISIANLSNMNSVEKNIRRVEENLGIYEFSIPGTALNWILKMAVFFASITLILLILRIFIGYTLEIGGRKFFLESRENNTYMGYLGEYFKEGRYFGVLKSMLLRDVFIILWTLLLIIPGIIKSYAYRMVPYILAENPSIGCNRAIELSNEMTKGEKWNIFVFDLSFIGWYLLGVIAFGLGVMFVNPYFNATEAELYVVLRQKAIENGKTTYEELNLVNDGLEV
ncbi:DUF975 family protein [Clostridium oceanicum]|uniref:DUF975 family protein n=1 Tax=Clostridium oceanicum TaxID=1543 RepID=A0ABP3UKH3_9CLOT